MRVWYLKSVYFVYEERKGFWKEARSLLVEGALAVAASNYFFQAVDFECAYGLSCFNSKANFSCLHYFKFFNLLALLCDTLYSINPGTCIYLTLHRGNLMFSTQNCTWKKLRVLTIIPDPLKYFRYLKYVQYITNNANKKNTRIFHLLIKN